jgi:hypothetical protein
MADVEVAALSPWVHASRSAGRKRGRLPFPDVLEPEVSELKSAGFCRLGEIQVRPPHFRDPVVTWVLINPSRLVAAELSWGRCRWHLNTHFEDGSWLVTDDPLGERTRAAGLWADTVGTSAAADVEHPRAKLQALSGSHGAPIELQRLPDFVDRDLADWQAHGLVCVGRMVRLQLTRAAADVFGVAALLLFGVPHAWFNTGGDEAMPILGQTILWMIPALLVMAVTDWLGSRPAMRTRGGKSRSVSGCPGGLRRLGQLGWNKTKGGRFPWSHKPFSI